MARLSQLFTPKEREFYDLFEEAGANNVRAATLLTEMLESWPEKQELTKEIVICEQTGDRVTHDLIARINATFVTSFDREDIIALASSLDDICDFTEEVADFLGLYRIEAPMEQAVQLAKVLVDACRQIEQALPRLRSYGDISHFVTEIHRLENDGDRIERSALASLF